HEPQHPHVVDGEKRRVVARLPLLRGIASPHPTPSRSRMSGTLRRNRYAVHTPIHPRSKRQEVGAESIGYGTGLQGTADRLDALGGTLEVRSATGEGTAVTGRVPPV